MFEEGDRLDLTSPKYPQHYPNRYNCEWNLQVNNTDYIYNYVLPITGLGEWMSVPDRLQWFLHQAVVSRTNMETSHSVWRRLSQILLGQPPSRGGQSSRQTGPKILLETTSQLYLRLLGQFERPIQNGQELQSEGLQLHSDVWRIWFLSTFCKNSFLRTIWWSRRLWWRVRGWFGRRWIYIWRWVNINNNDLS